MKMIELSTTPLLNFVLLDSVTKQAFNIDPAQITIRYATDNGVFATVQNPIITAHLPVDPISNNIDLFYRWQVPVEATATVGILYWTAQATGSDIWRSEEFIKTPVLENANNGVTLLELTTALKDAFAENNNALSLINNQNLKQLLLRIAEVL